MLRRGDQTGFILINTLCENNLVKLKPHLRTNRRQRNWKRDYYAIPLCLGFLIIAVLQPRASTESTNPGLFGPNTLGVNIHFTTPLAGEMDMLAMAGFRWVRMDFDWASTEQQPGQYDFSAYDVLLANLEPHGIRALLILDYSNPLYDGGFSPYDDEGRTAFANWAAAAARHFSGRGVVWEIYNEPDL